MMRASELLKTGTVKIVFIVLFFAILPFFLKSPYQYRIAAHIMGYITITVALNLIFAHTMQLFLCLGAIAGSSAYISTILARDFGISMWGTIAIGTIIAALLGSLISYVSTIRRLELGFTAILTLAMAVAFQTLIHGLYSITRGEIGYGVGYLEVGSLKEIVGWFNAAHYIFLTLLAISLTVYYFISRGRINLAFKAIKEDLLAAWCVGVDVVKYRVLAATIGSLMLGVVGSLLCYYDGFISPAMFTLDRIDIPAYVMLVFGGMETLLGPVIGGIVFTLLLEVTRPLGKLTLLVYGILLVILLSFVKEGVVRYISKKI